MGRRAFASTGPLERVVLAELADCTRNDDCPIAALDLLAGCRSRVEELDDLVVGRVTEAELMRSCQSLGATELVTEIPPDDTSPVGKGRPEYELAIDAESIHEFATEDHVLGDLLEEEPA